MRFLLLLTVMHIFVCNTQKLTYKTYSFQSKNFIGMSVPEDIYFNKRKIGIVKSLRSYKDYCMGTLEIESEFVVHCNVRFYNSHDLLNLTAIQISADSLDRCNSIVSSKDTIRIR